MLIDSIENKNLILKEFLELSVLEGWNDETLRKACFNCKIAEDLSCLIFENGALSVADYFSRNIDEATEAQIKALDLANMKVRDKIKESVKIRLKLNADYKEAIKRLIHFYYNPKHIANAIKNSYQTSDLIWRAIDDKSTDFNYYSKRTILSKLYVSTLKYYINDNSDDHQKTWKYLDEQIEKVMKIEKLKWKARNFVEKLGNITQNHPTENLKNCFKSVTKKLPFFRLFDK